MKTSREISNRLSCSLALFFCLLFFSLRTQTRSDQSQTQKSKGINNVELALNSYHYRLDKLNNDANKVNRKVNKAREQERIALLKLQKIQRELSNNQNQYLDEQRELEKIETQIIDSGKALLELEGEVAEQADLLKGYLCQIYIKRVNIIESIVNSILNSKSIIELINQFDYQKRLVQNQLDLIKTVKEKEQQIISLQTGLEEKKQSAQATIRTIKELKGSIDQKRKEQYKLVSKLRRERLSYEVAERQLERESNQLTKKILNLSNGSGIPLRDLIRSKYSYPVRARITSGFGYRRHPVFRVRSFHSGLDLGARYGTPVKSSNGGIVVFSGWYSGYGRTVIISHQGKSSLYAHLSRIPKKIKIGKKVYQGQKIGYVGSTGISTGPHLHFEIRNRFGKPVNPIRYLR